MPPRRAQASVFGGAVPTLFPAWLALAEAWDWAGLRQEAHGIMAQEPLLAFRGRECLFMFCMCPSSPPALFFLWICAHGLYSWHAL